ncbi:MAG: ImmA/IrrE family metallo-endopeptidase [Christiangramia sp.]|nr:ImmA/IrrE family metallo-endopeptidase [Christiangramia sp.]
MDIDYEIVSPPSATILRRISELDIDLKMFREYLELSIEEFGKLIHDQLKINTKMAYQLSQILGGSEIFWSNRYNNYIKETGKSNEQIYSEYKLILDGLCVSRKTDINNLLNDFQYSSFEHIVLDYFQSPIILYSKTQRFEPSPIKIANWIRECEKEAEFLIYDGKVRRFSPEVLSQFLSEIVAFTKVNQVNKILGKIQRICFDCGIVVLFKSSQSGYGISGFTKKILKNYRLVVITDRYKNNAAFWFTFFHELSHCLLHSLRFPLIHYSDDEFQLASLKTNNVFEEQEANEFVESLLFPEDIKNKIRECNSYKDILSLAVKYDISASLIVAQIHREKLAPHSWYRKVYRKVEF